MAEIRITTIPWAPPAFQGQVRDLAVRWALEEAGLKYDVQLAADAERSSAAYRQRQPFGKVPLYEHGDLVLFESGAIVLHIAEENGLLPSTAQARARAKAWLIAALNSLDPDFAAREDWARTRRPAVVAMVNSRLRDVAAQLGREDFLAGEFSAADIMMIMVLRALRHTTLVTDIPLLRAYRDRCEARPAFQRALAAQLATFAQHASDTSQTRQELT